MIFRNDAGSQLTPEQLQAVTKPWQDWMGGLAAQNKLVDQGNRLHHDGKVVKPGKIITNGAFVEVKEAIGGYTVIRASSLEEATELSKDCPILVANGSVEVREIAKM